ncbi:hypothetical protein ES705_27573 [subsurface metagenome]
MCTIHESPEVKYRKIRFLTVDRDKKLIIFTPRKVQGCIRFNMVFYADSRVPTRSLACIVIECS